MTERNRLKILQQRWSNTSLCVITTSWCTDCVSNSTYRRSGVRNGSQLEGYAGTATAYFAHEIAIDSKNMWPN